MLPVPQMKSKQFFLHRKPTHMHQWRGQCLVLTLASLEMSKGRREWGLKILSILSNLMISPQLYSYNCTTKEKSLSCLICSGFLNPIPFFLYSFLKKPMLEQGTNLSIGAYGLASCGGRTIWISFVEPVTLKICLCKQTMHTFLCW